MSKTIFQKLANTFNCNISDRTIFGLQVDLNDEFRPHSNPKTLAYKNLNTVFDYQPGETSPENLFHASFQVSKFLLELIYNFPVSRTFKPTWIRSKTILRTYCLSVSTKAMKPNKKLLEIKKKDSELKND